VQKDPFNRNPRKEKGCIWPEDRKTKKNESPRKRGGKKGEEERVGPALYAGLRLEQTLAGPRPTT